MKFISIGQCSGKNENAIASLLHFQMDFISLYFCTRWATLYFHLLLNNSLVSHSRISLGSIDEMLAIFWIWKFWIRFHFVDALFFYIEIDGIEFNLQRQVTKKQWGKNKSRSHSDNSVYDRNASRPCFHLIHTPTTTYTRQVCQQLNEIFRLMNGKENVSQQNDGILVAINRLLLSIKFLSLSSLFISSLLASILNL